MDGNLVGIMMRLLAVVALVFANGFFVAAEFSLVTVRRTRVDQLMAEGNRLARTVRRALSDPESFIAATQVGITMASLGLGWIGEPAVASTIEPIFDFLPATLSAATAHTIAGAIAFAFITSLHIVLGELAPKTIALQHAETTALYVAKPTELFMKLCWPFITFLNWLGQSVVRAIGLKPSSRHSLVHSEEELKMLVTASQEAGVLEENEELMLHRVFGFADLTAGQIMVPRTEMVALPASMSLSDVIARISEGRHTRVPVYRESLDDIIGILHVEDLFGALAAPERFDLAALAREVLTVPETMRADDLLTEMRRHRAHEALVIDEYGGTAGLVTFIGLMERIGGDFGPTSGKITLLADGSAIVNGLALVTDINERFGLHIDEETYTTIGGFVLGKLGRKARVGDRVDVNGRMLRVDALDGMRVARVFLAREHKHGTPEASTVDRE